MTDPVRDQFQDAIARYFAYLFTAHGFQFVAAMNERYGEYQMQIAASATCQVKFTLEQATFGLCFARQDAPRTWRNEEGTIQWWHPVEILMQFEDELHPDQIANLPPGAAGDPTLDTPPLDTVLTAYATLLQPYLPRFLAAFSSSPPAGWWPAYKTYRTRVFGMEIVDPA